MKHVMGTQDYGLSGELVLNTNLAIRISHCVFLISHWRLVWSLSSDMILASKFWLINLMVNGYKTK